VLARLPSDLRQSNSSEHVHGYLHGPGL
jgi:hypothetical protein